MNRSNINQQIQFFLMALRFSQLYNLALTIPSFKSLPLIPVYEYWAKELDNSGIRFRYSIQSDGDKQGWTKNGIAYYAPNTYFNNTTPLYQYYAYEVAPNDGLKYLYNTQKPTSSQTLGWTYDGTYWNVLNSQVEGSLPVYQFSVSNQGGMRFYYSFDKYKPTTEGWTYDQIAFYAYNESGNSNVNKLLASL